MNRKKIVSLILLLLLLVILCAVYLFNNKDKNSQESNTQNESVDTITIANTENVKQVNISNSNSNYSIVISEDNYSVKGYEKNTFSQAALKQIGSYLSNFNAKEIVSEDNVDLSKYGLSSPSAIAEVNGDSSYTIKIGDITADGKYYYASSNLNNSVYMINRNYGEMLISSMNDLIDMSVPQISTDSVSYIDVKYDHKPEILIKSDEENETLKNYVSSSGLSALIMDKPIKNAIVYPTNLKDEMLCDLPSMTLNKVVSLNSDNLGKYGLDKPSLHIVLKDTDNSLELIVGNKYDDTSYYAMVDDRPEVYTITSDNINAFENADIMNFIQNFIALHKRSDVSSIEIKIGENVYNLSFKEEENNKIAVDSEGVKRDNRNLYVDNQKIDSSSVGDLYEMIVGINFDSINFSDKPTKTLSSASIIYTLMDGNTDTVNLYNYNDNFYYIQKDTDSPIMLVNKQQFTQLQNKIGELKK